MCSFSLYTKAFPRNRHQHDVGITALLHESILPAKSLSLSAGYVMQLDPRGLAARPTSSA